jgi:hypothetical protein
MIPDIRAGRGQRMMKGRSIQRRRHHITTLPGHPSTKCLVAQMKASPSAFATRLSDILMLRPNEIGGLRPRE